MEMKGDVGHDAPTDDATSSDGGTPVPAPGYPVVPVTVVTIVTGGGDQPKTFAGASDSTGDDV